MHFTSFNNRFHFFAGMGTSKCCWLKLLLIVATLGRLSSSQEAQRCDPSYCRLPDCFCGGTKIPGDLKKDKTPQFVLLTFDDAVNGLNQKFFKDLFKNRLNPNGCPIKVKTYLLTKQLMNDLFYCQSYVIKSAP